MMVQYLINNFDKSKLFSAHIKIVLLIVRHMLGFNINMISTSSETWFWMIILDHSCKLSRFNSLTKVLLLQETT
jgi:hypothetical protein